MTVEDFSEKHKLSRSAIFVATGNGSVPKSVLYRPMNSKLLHVDESWFLRRVDFRKKVYAYIQDMYYFHFEPNYSDYEIAEMLGCSHTYVMYDMWTGVDVTILRFKIPRVTWNAFRKCRLIERVRYKRYNPDFNLEYELDKMAGIVA